MVRLRAWLLPPLPASTLEVGKSTSFLSSRAWILASSWGSSMVSEALSRSSTSKRRRWAEAFSDQVTAHNRTLSVERTSARAQYRRQTTWLLSVSGGADDDESRTRQLMHSSRNKEAFFSDRPSWSRSVILLNSRMSGQISARAR